MKKGLNILIIAATIAMFSLFAMPVFAQNTQYQQLAPLPLVGISNGSATTTVATYLPGAVKLIIALAGALTVLKLVMAGLKYMTTEAFTGKQGAKDDITNALLGFLLVISSYIILNTINPQLLNFKLDLEAVKTVDSGNNYLQIPVTEFGTEGSDVDAIIAGPSNGTVWNPDVTIRSELSDLSKGEITVSTPTCTTIGQQHCTSVYGLSSKVVSGLLNLANVCKAPITVTGGTEYWLHGKGSTEISGAGTSHQPGGNVVDLSRRTTVTACIESKGTQVPNPGGCTPGVAYTFPGGGLYVNEQFKNNPPHWHVCY